MFRAKKKQQIVDSSIDLFAEHGIADVSFAMIAKEIGSSRGTIYYHFKNGKPDIIAAILQMYEDCVNSCVPAKSEWESKDADAETILFKLFFQFPKENMLKLRKIVRITMSNMFLDEQIKNHAMNFFITGREDMLFKCLQSLEKNGKIVPLDAETMARYFNRYLVVCAMEDAIRYP